MEIVDDGVLIMHRMTIRRYGRVGMYFILLASGVILAFSPSEIVRGELSHSMNTLWAFCIVSMSTVALAGALTDLWIGEFIGLPLLIASLSVYGVSAIASSNNRDSPPLLAVGLVFLAFSCGLSARWRDVQMVRRQAMEQSA